MRKQFVHKGFTLIELLVVIAVVGVLAGAVIAIINPNAQFARARNAQRKTDLREIANALLRYATSRGVYPSTGGAWCNTANIGTYVCGTNPMQTLVTSGDLKKIPIDPRIGTAYLPCNTAPDMGYLYRSDTGADYKILAHCSPEGDAFSATDPFYDPVRPTNGWQISTPGGASY